MSNLDHTVTKDEVRSGLREELQELVKTSNMEVITVEAGGCIPLHIIDEILDTGALVCGAGKCGKTTWVRVINRELMKVTKLDEGDNEVPYIQIKIFDTALNWIKAFEPILYQVLSERELLNVGTEIYFGDDDIIFECSDFTDNKAIREVISEIVGADYELHRRYKLNDLLDTNIVYTIEEAQNVLSVIGKYDRWNTYISQGRNMNISFLFITRRMADLSAKARENVQSYMWGKMTGDNERRRIRRISNDTVYNMLPKLGIGEFIYWNGVTARLIINKDRYEIDTKPVRWYGTD